MNQPVFCGRRSLIRSLALLIILGLTTVIMTACQPTTTPPPTPGTPSLPPSATTITLDDTPVRPGGLCVPGAFDLINQSTTVTVALTFDAGGIIDRIGVTATNGTYTGMVAAVLPITCDPDPVIPPAGPWVATYGLTYLGDFSREQTICINASRADFTAISITGLPVIDGVVSGAVRGNIHLAMDLNVADRMNELLNGVPLPTTANPRCANWIDLAAP
jgi:hypothetical protein